MPTKRRHRPWPAPSTSCGRARRDHRRYSRPVSSAALVGARLPGPRPGAAGSSSANSRRATVFRFISNMARACASAVGGRAVPVSRHRREPDEYREAQSGDVGARARDRRRGWRPSHPLRIPAGASIPTASRRKAGLGFVSMRERLRVAARNRARRFRSVARNENRLHGCHSV